MARLRPRLKSSFRRSTTRGAPGVDHESRARTREIELTSYAEIVLAPPAADAAHPAFSNLFVQTEFAPELGALLATRRPRSHDEPQVWAAHVVVAEGETVGELQYETDRGRFLGRGRGSERRCRSSTATHSPTRSARYSTQSSASAPRLAQGAGRGSPSRRSSRHRAMKRSPWPTSTTIRQRLSAPPPWRGRRPRSSYIISALILMRPTSFKSSPARSCIRTHAAAFVHRTTGNTRGPSALWQHGISGDIPIILVRIDEPEDQGIVRQLPAPTNTGG